MVNAQGINQYGTTNYPPDDILIETFKQYAKEKSGSGLTAKEQVARLKVDLDFAIGRTTLFELRRRLGIPTVRNTKVKTTPQERAQVILDIKANDVLGRWGVAQVRQRVANTAGLLIARDEAREILHDHFDEEFSERFAGSRLTLSRQPLRSLGPWHQIHCDGHEKLSFQALQLGGDVSIPIYAYKDQFSSFNPFMRVVPNSRDPITIGHLYLDFVEESDGQISIQTITDKGSEIGEMIRIQAILRADAAPEYTEEEWPSSVQVQSKHNTPIEGFWLWQRKGEGHNIRNVLEEGKNRGIFNGTDYTHVQVFNWLWPALVQRRLDEYREYWNNHLLRRQPKKANPSGTSPRQLWLAPESAVAKARNCAIRVDMDLVTQLREDLGGMEGRDKAFRFVSKAFEAKAEALYQDLGSPLIDLTNAWHIFALIVDAVRAGGMQ